MLTLDRSLSSETVNVAASGLPFVTTELPPSVYNLLYLTNEIGDPLPSDLLLTRIQASTELCSVKTELTDQATTMDESPTEQVTVRRLVSHPPRAKAKVESQASAAHREDQKEDEVDWGKIGRETLLKYRDPLKGSDSGQSTGFAIAARPPKPPRPFLPHAQVDMMSLPSTSSQFAEIGNRPPPGLPVPQVRSAPPILPGALAELDAALLQNRTTSLSMLAKEEPPPKLDAASLQPSTITPMTNTATQLAEANRAYAVSEYDSDEEDEEYLDPDEPVEIIVGPTDLATMPFRLQDLSLPQRSRMHTGIELVPLTSWSRCLSVRDAMALSRVGEAPISFGSVVHLNYGVGNNCRPCMFERWKGRCCKRWLCDFCHLHAKNRSHQAASSSRRPR